MLNIIIKLELARVSQVFSAGKFMQLYTRVRLGIPTAICGRTDETSITDSRLWKIQMLVSITGCYMRADF
jgi:hypothetical protein